MHTLWSDILTDSNASWPMQIFERKKIIPVTRESAALKYVQTLEWNKFITYIQNELIPYSNASKLMQTFKWINRIFTHITRRPHIQFQCIKIHVNILIGEIIHLLYNNTTPNLVL